MKKIDLLIIDPQIDFCDPSGNLYVKGAEKDMSRVAKMIDRIGDKLHGIHVTLDSHHLFDIAHPIYWKNSKGEHPKWYTEIIRDEVENGVWMSTLPSLTKRAIDYSRQLDKNKRYPLRIWPPHCLIGSKGHQIFPELFESLIKWEEKARIVNKVTKGSNPHTEHYSAIKADVIDPSDTSTQINTPFIQMLESVDMILTTGEALDYCLANTVRDTIAEFSDQGYAKKFVILEDGSSCVNAPGAEHLGTDFLNEMRDLGVEISTTDEV